MNKRKIAVELLKLAKELIAFTPYEESYLNNRSAPKTPWGLAQHGYFIADGVTFYTTAGHGGILVERRAAGSLSKEARALGDSNAYGYWYEEDVAIAIPFYEQPKWQKAMSRLVGGGSPVSKQRIEKELERWYPEYLQAVKGKK